MKRAFFSVAFCAMALGLGVVTARLAASNRARGDELAHRHRISDTRELQNALRRVEIDRLEWLILQDQGTPLADSTADAFNSVEDLRARN